jgi:hypothetical protein
MSIRRISFILSTLALCLEVARVSAWSPRISPSTTPTNGPALPDSRRSLFFTASALLTSAVVPSSEARADTGAEVRGTPLTPFNGLAFQYRGSEFGGLTSSELSEPSISYADFMTKLKAGEVELVEFLAPDGDAAYATFKNQPPIRIGEGYPVEQHDGWSSPAFAVRAVKNAGIPFKFIVPALQKYK